MNVSRRELDNGGEVVLLTDVTESHLMQVLLARQQRFDATGFNDDWGMGYGRFLQLFHLLIRLSNNPVIRTRRIEIFSA